MAVREIATLVVCICVLIGPGRADEPLVFESDIQPLLAQKCGKCHGANARKGGLDLSSIQGLRRGGESGEPVIAPTPDESLLWIMANGGGMPPEGEPPLTGQELAIIERWLVSGANSNKPAELDEQQLTQHDVLPILLLRCTTCHGARLQQGGLDLRSPAAMRKGGKSGPAFVAGNPDDSLMIRRIESEACPPRQLLLKFFVSRPPVSEVAALRDWIAAGAPEVEVAPDVAGTEPDPLVTDQDRRHWAFQPPLSTLQGASVDSFILEKLREKGLTFSPEADRDTLIRRAYLDLVGMPPGLEEWERWHAGNEPDWYPRMIDSLLASPRYGERWGRYWLDLAGYADSEGGVSADPIREVAWKYRDYVIRALNEDKPYDRFLLEQIAGDELLDYENAPVVTQEMVDNLVATGFLRMGIDQTGSRTMNFVPERLGVIADAMTIVSSGVMGLTIGCARCHSHKYDPLPQRDYFRLKAVFQGALDEHDWLTFKNRKLEVGTPQQRERVRTVNPPLAAELKRLEARLKTAEKDLQIATLLAHYPEQSEDERRATLAALKVADNNRTLPQRLLVERLQQAEALPDSRQPENVLAGRRHAAELKREIEAVRRRMAPPLEIRALWDRGEPSPTYLLRRGEYNKPGPLVGPGVPSMLTNGRTPLVVQPPFPSGTSKTGRRLAFARWLTQPDNPLTARVMVNRIWHHHFGVGLVETLENFGLKGGAPSHPELLGWLALEFVERGWSIKEMHRVIMNSQTYRQSSRITAERIRIDPQNRLLSRMPLLRMNAEAVRDSLLFVSGCLDDTPGGRPDGVSVDQDGLVSVVPSADGKWRRSIYAQFRRTEIPTMLDTFDYPEMGPNCIARGTSTVSPQSLMLMNNQQVRELAAAFAARVEQIAGDRMEDRPAQVDTVYRLALSRLPSDQERRLGIESLSELAAVWQGSEAAPLEVYCHTILNSAAFLYID
jgi:cytochrome c553